MQILEGKCKIILFTFRAICCCITTTTFYPTPVKRCDTHSSYFLSFLLLKFNHNPTPLREYYTDYNHLPPRLSENPVVQHVKARK